MYHLNVCYIKWQTVALLKLYAKKFLISSRNLIGQFHCHQCLAEVLFLVLKNYFLFKIVMNSTYTIFYLFKKFFVNFLPIYFIICRKEHSVFKENFRFITVVRVVCKTDLTFYCCYTSKLVSCPDKRQDILLVRY